MKAYRVTTTFWGADGPSMFYFSTEDGARNFLADLYNGEVEEITVKINKLPFEGCNWGDIVYYLFN